MATDVAKGPCHSNIMIEGLHQHNEIMTSAQIRSISFEIYVHDSSMHWMH